jgi:hypothetical protein
MHVCSLQVLYRQSIVISLAMVHHLCHNRRTQQPLDTLPGSSVLCTDVHFVPLL